MRITIAYDSSWRNSFLEGSNNEPLPKGGRNFVGSMTALKTEGNFIERSITKDTVMGLLNRLIGEQRKLYQARLDPNYCLADIEAVLSDADIIDKVDKQVINSETVYIRNISGSTDQNAFTGMIKSTDPAFTSNFSNELWGVLYLSCDEVLRFINDVNYSIIDSHSLDPMTVINQLEQLNDLKAIDVSDEVKQVLNYLNHLYPDVEYKLTAKGQFTPISLYTSALYIQVERLKTRFDMNAILTKSGGLSGISKRGFTKKDFMERYTTGNKKIIWGNPYMLKQKIKGEGERVSLLTKASGVLEINININKERANELKTLIENAAVSAFYLGKKGLAYVENIR
jgi:Cas5fv helical domain